MDTAKREGLSALRQYLAGLNQGERLAHLDEEAVLRRAQSGEPRALEAFFVRNLGLVMREAHRHCRDHERLPDYLEEGFVGLHKALQRFDPTRGFRFSSYAMHWIRMMITNYAMSEDAPVHVPHKKRQLMRNCKITYRRLAHQGYSHQQALEATAEAVETSVSQVATFVAVGQAPTSLQAPVGESDSVLGDHLVAASPDPADEAEKRSLKRRLRACIAELPEREQTLLHRAYGLDGREPASYSEIAREQGLSRQVLSAIGRRAERRLRGLLFRAQAT